MAQDYDKLAEEKYPVGGMISGGPFVVRIDRIEQQFENRFVSLREVTYSGPDGKFFQARSVLVMLDGMLVVPVMSDGTFVMVKVFRPGSNQWAWEFPQERIVSRDGRSEALRCAREEIGLIGDFASVRFLGEVDSMPDRVTETTHMWVVEGDFDFSQRLDKAEVPDECIRAFTASDIRHGIRASKIRCPCAISAFYRYLETR